MTVHGIGMGTEVFGVAVSVAALLIFTLAIALRHRPTVPPGSSGHREISDTEHEEIRADGYIDSFSHEIEEAGGGMPLVVRLSLVGVLAWFVIYLILFWSPS